MNTYLHGATRPHDRIDFPSLPLSVCPSPIGDQP